MHYLLIQTGRDVRDETSKINKTETFCCLMAPFCEISLLLLSRFVKQFLSMLMIKLFLGRWHSFANLWEHILELVHYYAIPYIIYYNLNIMLLLAFVDIFESMFIFQFRIWNRGITSSISQRLCNVHDDVRKKVYRRNIKPHCIHICKVNSTILCEIRYQKFTGVKPCLKYSNDNRNELQGLSRNVMKTIYIYIYINRHNCK